MCGWENLRGRRTGALPRLLSIARRRKEGKTLRRKLPKLMAFFLVLCLAVPMFAGLAGVLTAEAASASLNATSKKIYLGATFQLKVQNVDMDTVKSITWKANRSSIAKVDQNGLVTPVKVGTTTIKCTITYKDGTSTLLTCSAIVRQRVEATAVKLTNVTLDDGNAKSMYVGSTFTIKKSVTPSNTTDSVYYISDDESVATVSTSGVITAKKPGVTLIEVRYGLNKTEAVSADNKAAAKFYLHVVEKPAPTATPTPTPTATPTPTPVPELPKVTSAKMVGSQELQVTFNQPVRKSSLISGNKLISGTIIIGREEKATDFGTLTGTLSSDGKTLAIRGTGSFNGTYSIVVSGKVLSDAGAAFEQYAEIMTYKDTTGPVYTGTTVGYNGWVSSINFDEAIDISNMTIEGVSGTTDAVLSGYLKDPMNYTLSSDKKSLTIDLSAYTTDKALLATVILKGIRDSAGNTTSKQLQSVYVRTDASTKPLASIVSTERISKTELEVVFSAEIASAGYAQFGTNTVYGIIDSEDPKIVRYEIPVSYQSMTGYQVVTFNSWYNYNAAYSTSPAVARPVDFTLDTTPPQLISYEMTNAVVDGRTVCKLVLTYDKEIMIATTAQSITARVKNTNGDISSQTVMSTMATVESTIVTYIFEESMMLENGQFTLTLPANMVADKLENFSKAVTLMINKTGTSSDELPAPTAATQDPVDLSTIYLSFANKVDADTAEQIQNYYVISGTSRSFPVAATVIENGSSGATVALTFNTGTFTSNFASYELVVTGVKGYGGSFGAISGASIVFTAIENNPPRIAAVSTISYGIITMTMSEEVTGTLTVTATDTVTGATYTGTGAASGKYIYINLNGIPTSKTVRFVITENNIIDLNGNKANFTLNQPYIANAN